MLLLAGVVQFFVCGGFANKRESRTYGFVNYLRRRKNDQKQPQHHILLGECFSSSAWMYAFLRGSTTLVVFSKQRTSNFSKCHDLFTGMVTWLITIPVMIPSVLIALPVQ